MVAQLKSYGYYSIAKNIEEQTGDMVGINVEASNALQESCRRLLEKNSIDINASGDGNLKINNKENTSSHNLVWKGKSENRPNPNYRTWFNTQHKGHARTVAFSGDGSFVATGSEDMSLKVLDVQIILSRDPSNDDKRVLKTLYDHTAQVNEVAFHPNGAVVASCSDDGNIKFFDLQKQNTKRGFRYLADSYPVHSIAFHPSGEFMISGTEHHAVRLYDIQTMKAYIPSSPADHHKGPITRVRYAPNGSTFATCSLDGSIKIYDTVNGKCVNTIHKAHDGASVIGLCFSKNSSYLLSTGLDSKGILWDMGSGKALCRYEGALQKYDHAPMVFSFNEAYIIGQDAASNMVVIWDTQTGDLIRKMKGVHDDKIHQIAASPVDAGFMTCGSDNRARYWSLN